MLSEYDHDVCNDYMLHTAFDWVMDQVNGIEPALHQQFQLALEDAVAVLFLNRFSIESPYVDDEVK